MSSITPIHPGEHLAEFLDEYGLSQYRLAKSVSVPPIRISEIVNGKRRVTADTALRLGRFFGMSAMFWLNLQTRYDLECAEAGMANRIKKEVRPLAM